jgi:hypothetical protein
MGEGVEIAACSSFIGELFHPEDSGNPRLTLGALEDRCLPSVTQFPIPTINKSARGDHPRPDGNLWLAEIHAIGRITPEGPCRRVHPGPNVPHRWGSLFG